jgi:hypothetical protein
MKREGWKVFSASALGAGLGAFVALEVAAWLWWLGLLVGGLVGYLSYEFKAVLAALPKAYRAARGWRANSRYWVDIAWAIAGTTSFFLCLVIAIGVFALMCGEPLDTVLHNVGVLTAAFTFACVFMAPLLMTTVSPSRYEADTCSWRRFAYCVFPPLVIFYHLPRGLWWIIRRIPRAVAVAAIGVGRSLLALARFLPRFGWQIFIRIHSEMRILCGTDAMAGAAVGYFAGSAIIGAVVGGLFGVANYALVTERWLRPRGYLPARAK